MCQLHNITLKSIHREIKKKRRNLLPRGLKKNKNVGSKMQEY